ncbi:MAG: hypothetical protein M5T61_21475 [Acidimicrobiia bacterium]|nr:hypothetical protein [Acidimicrobiia bacterium]
MIAPSDTAGVGTTNVATAGTGSTASAPPCTVTVGAGTTSSASTGSAAAASDRVTVGAGTTSCASIGSAVADSVRATRRGGHNELGFDRVGHRLERERHGRSWDGKCCFHRRSGGRERVARSPARPVRRSW